MNIFFKLLGDFRYLCFALLLSHFYWLFFSAPDWFVKQFYLSLAILFLGCIFSKQRFIFGILLFLCLTFQAKYIWSPNSVFHSSYILKQNCQKNADFFSAHFDKRVGDYLWLSKGIIGCGKKRFFFPSAVLKIPQHRFIGVYPGQQIKIIQVTIHQDRIHQYKVNQDKTIGLFDISTLHFEAGLGSRFTAIRKKNQGKLWKDWKLTADYYLSGAAKPLYLGIALADRSDLPSALRQKLQHLGIFHLFAISGLHIGMIFLLLRFLLSKFLALSLVLLQFFNLQFNRLFNQMNVYFYADWVSVGLLWFYLSFIGSPLTAIRAWTMLLIWLFIHYFIRWIPTNYVLLLIAISMLLLEPSLITSVSFLLSFCSVFAILVYLKLFDYKEKKMKEYFGLKSILSFAWKNKFSQNLSKIVAISFFINLFILPVLLFYFQQKNLLGFANNLFHIPFMSLLYLPATLLGFILLPFKTFWIVEILYFASMQQLGNIWYWVIQKNTSLNSIIIEKMPFLQLENEALNSVFWVFYFTLLIGVLFFYFKKNQTGDF